ncbi:Gfo/Idh/MocA family protein [Catellatospora vulcania]|uniref:Gfo/Idh/MocA family protein n=1 Tax=Catellatospora vulcania TaxID=1460450 RepID=UPI0012D40DBD|nr:Gfo/Idh/MocA family oxidoreductase [Catellatospora vulcania]
MSAPVTIGLVGAGPWARAMHAPVFAAGPETALTAVWARRPEAAAPLAEQYGAALCTDFDELLDRCEAVAFAVPPDVQADLAVRAARAGKALFLDKPLALDLPAARRLVDAVEDAGVPTQMMLGRRYHATVRTFLDEVRAVDAIGARSSLISGSLLGGDFATPWRLAQGALYDLAPHLLDLLDAALGPIIDLSARGDSRTWIEISCTHANGAISQASLSGAVGVPGGRRELSVYSRDGAWELPRDIHYPDAFATVRAEFATVVRTWRSHELDAQRGLYLQQLLSALE